MKNDLFSCNCSAGSEIVDWNRSILYIDKDHWKQLASCLSVYIQLSVSLFSHLPAQMPSLFDYIWQIPTKNKDSLFSLIKSIQLSLIYFVSLWEKSDSALILLFILSYPVQISGLVVTSFPSPWFWFRKCMQLNKETVWEICCIKYWLMCTK